MDICHLKNAELETKHQKYKGRVVLRGDIVKDNSWILCSIYRTRIISITNDCSNGHGSYPDCQGAQDKHLTQYLLFTQVKMEDASKLLKISKSECPDIWIRLPRDKWRKS